jgi:phage I-like protein
VNKFTKAATRRVRPISHVTAKTATPFRALCSAAASAAAGGAIALAAEGGAPAWVQLMPAGPTLEGRDGRSWRIDDVNRLVAQFSPPFVIDYEHAQDHLAVNGQEAPAAGWAEELQVRGGGEIWARVDWTERAAKAIAAREYRFISPAFTYSPADGSVQALIGASLVNRPNFVMTALNAQESSMLKAIAAALGLAETATSPEIVTAIGALKVATALNAQQPDLARFVPRADYELALNRATAAEAKIAADGRAAHETKVALAIDEAVKAGKVAPASREFYVATCATAEGLAAFEKFVASAPTAFREIVDPKKDEPGAGGVALNSEQLAAAKALGLDAKKFAAFVAERAATA